MFVCMHWCASMSAGTRGSALLSTFGRGGVQFWETPLFLLFPHDQSFPSTPALVYFNQKINKNKISKDKRHCITFCIMEAAKWHHERLSPPGKRFPSGLPFPRMSLVAVQQFNYWSYPEGCVKLIKTLGLMCMPWRAAECMIDRGIRYYWW